MRKDKARNDEKQIDRRPQIGVGPAPERRFEPKQPARMVSHDLEMKDDDAKRSDPAQGIDFRETFRMPVQRLGHPPPPECYFLSVSPPKRLLKRAT